MIIEENVNECDIDEDENRINQGEIENSKFRNNPFGKYFKRFFWKPYFFK